MIPIWDTMTGDCHQEITALHGDGNSFSLNNLAFSADGLRLKATASWYRPRRVHFIDLATGQGVDDRDMGQYKDPSNEDRFLFRNGRLLRVDDAGAEHLAYLPPSGVLGSRPRSFDLGGGNSIVAFALDRTRLFILSLSTL